MGAGKALLLASVFSFFAVLSASGAAYADCAHTIPNVTISPTSMTANPGQTVALNVQVYNKDPGTCPLGQFTMNGSSPGGLTVFFSPSTVFILPGDSENLLMKVTVPSDAATKDYDVRATAASDGGQAFDISTIHVQQQVSQCQASVSNLRFRETNGDVFTTQFSESDEVGVYADVLMSNPISGNVTLQLFADGNLIDSDTDVYPGNSQTTFKFDSKILTGNYNDHVNVKVTALADCNPSQTSQSSQTIYLVPNSGAKVETTMGVISNAMVGDTVTSRIFVVNKGENSTLVNLRAFLCDVADNCNAEMYCGEGSIFLIDKQVKKEIDCNATISAQGEYVAKSRVTFGSDQDTQLSNSFFVNTNTSHLMPGQAPPQASSGGQVSTVPVSYMCSGSMRQVLIPTGGGTVASDLEYCPNGCSGGQCLAYAQPSKPAQTAQGAGQQQTQLTGEKTFSKPPFDSNTIDLGAFFAWLKNLLFPNAS